MPIQFDRPCAAVVSMLIHEVIKFFGCPDKILLLIRDCNAVSPDRARVEKSS